MEEIVKEVLEGAMKGDALSIAYLIVSALVVIMAIVAFVMKILIAVRYWKANKMPISSRMTGAEAARYTHLRRTESRSISGWKGKTRRKSHGISRSMLPGRRIPCGRSAARIRTRSGLRMTGSR